jgi:hypothetical protein
MSVEPPSNATRCPICKEPMATPEWECACGKYKICSRPSCMISIPVEHRTGGVRQALVEMEKSPRTPL